MNFEFENVADDASNLPEPEPDQFTTPRRSAWRFVVVFAVCIIGLLTGYRSIIDTIAMDGYLYSISLHTTGVLNLIGQEARLEKYAAEGLSPWQAWRDRARNRHGIEENGPRITFKLSPLSTFTFIVVPSCGAIEVMAIFIAAVIAFPTKWRHRVQGILAGLPLMYVINILRLVCLACLGALDQGGAWFTFVHEYVCQASYVVFVVLVWMAWVELGKEGPV